MNQIKISVIGASGRLGSEILSQILNSKEFILVEAIVSSKSKCLGEKIHSQDAVYVNKCSKRADVIIDASNPARLKESISEAESLKVPLLVLSTGHDPEIINTVKPKIAFCYAPNTSYGIYLVNEAVRVLSEQGKGAFSFHLTETHHSLKKDAPSGTAIAISNTAKQYGVEMEIQSIRGGTVPGEHEMKMLGTFEEIVLTHKAQSRALFAHGALVLASRLCKHSDGRHTSAELFSVVK